MFSHKKIALTLLFVLGSASTAFAHDFWMQGSAPKAGQKLTAEIGFGHSFAKTEPLQEQMLNSFNPVEVVGVKGKLAMEPGAANNVFTSKKAVEKGSYYVLGSMKPNVFTRAESGFSRKYKNEVEAPMECNEYNMYSKGIVNIDSAGDLDFLKKPQGQKLEIIPQVLPSSVKPGQPMQFLVLYDGAPLAWAEVAAVLDGFSHGDENAKAFASKTNKNGLVNFIPLVEGYWKVAVIHKTPYQNKDLCDNSNYIGSITFKIGN